MRCRALAACLLALALVPAAAASERAPAIVGGSLAAPGAWPWAAAIGWVLPDGHVSPACTGSLVGERWVLTASHCARPTELLGLATTGEEVTFRIAIGETDIRTPPPESTYAAGAGDVVAIPAPAGSAGTDLDLALIRLDRPAPEQAVRIPGAGQSAEAAALAVPGTAATVVGWGLESETSADISYDLRQVDVPIVADEDCRDAYPLFEGFGLSIGFDARTMVCAGLPEGGKDACAGDSGGPLMVPDGYGGWVQVGITSWGEGCARAGRPGIYARLAGLFGFIVTRTAGDPEAPTAEPDAVTGTAAAVTRRRATLTGAVTPNGLATSYRIELGTNQRYHTGRVQGYAGAGTVPVAVEATFSGLRPGRTYHYRVTATSVAGVVRGYDETFTTPAAKKKPRR